MANFALTDHGVVQLAAADLSNGVTGSGALALATSPSLVTPALGVASATSIAIGGGTVLSTSNQTGTGSLVLAASPTFTGTVTTAAISATTVSASGQITSTVSTGTAPLVVASTTNVANLNASSLNGATFAAPGAIGGGTAAAGTFTTLTANTSLVINGGTALTTSNQTGTGSLVLAASPTFTGTVALPTATLTGKITNYNAIATVSNGIPAEYATVDLTAQTAAIAATTAYAVPASGAGQYRVSWDAKVTTAAGTSSTLGGATGFQVVYTDNDDAVVVTTPAWWGGGNNGAAPTSAALNTTQTWISGSVTVNAKASTNIQYAIGYTSAGTAMQYSLHIKVEAL